MLPMFILRARYLVLTALFCPLGLHCPWPEDPWHPRERCAYCGKKFDQKRETR
jgi:hypothetical protein